MDVALTNPAGTTFTVNSGAANGIDLNVTGYFGDPGSAANYGLIKAGNGVMQLLGANTYTGSTTISAGTLAIGGGGILGSGNYGAAISNSGALFPQHQHNQTFSGVISGSGALYQLGSSVTTLSGSNSYTGSTTIGGGTLAISGAGVLGGGNYSERVPNSGTMIVKTSSNQTFSGVISGNGTLYQLGTGVATLTAANTYSGGTTISAGTLTIGGAGVLGGGNYSAAIANSGALVVNTSSNQTFSGVISGNGALYQNGSSVTTLSGSNTYTGGTTVAAGTLKLDFSQAGAPDGQHHQQRDQCLFLGLGRRHAGNPRQAQHDQQPTVQRPDGQSGLFGHRPDGGHVEPAAPEPGKHQPQRGRHGRFHAAQRHAIRRQRHHHHHRRILNGILGGYATVGRDRLGSLQAARRAIIVAYSCLHQRRSWLAGLQRHPQRLAFRRAEHRALPPCRSTR